MQTYETLFVSTPTLTEEDEQATVDTFSVIVTEGGGTMVANERMGRRRLAYPIRKQTDGVYVRFLYDSEASVPKELERRMGLSDKILRVLTVRLEERQAVQAKEQAVRDAQARVEAAEREAQERAEAERKALEEPAETEVEAEAAAETPAAPSDSEPSPAPAVDPTKETES
jgi:small subunit ribosomal protein S6